jgi:hypothetical protein
VFWTNCLSVLADFCKVLGLEITFEVRLDDLVTFFGLAFNALAEVALREAIFLVEVFVLVVAAGRIFFAATFFAESGFDLADLTLSNLDALGADLVLPPEEEDLDFPPEAVPVPRAAVTGFLMCVRTEATVSAWALAPTG